MTITHGTHIEAPVEKVFNFFKDPNNWRELPHADQLTEVTVTDEGVGTCYRVILPIPGIRIRALGVFTEFIPNRRITDRSSLSLVGAVTFSFEPERAGNEADDGEPSAFLLADPAVERAGGMGHGKAPQAIHVRAKGQDGAPELIPEPSGPCDRQVSRRPTPHVWVIRRPAPAVRFAANRTGCAPDAWSACAPTPLAWLPPSNRRRGASRRRPERRATPDMHKRQCARNPPPAACRSA